MCVLSHRSWFSKQLTIFDRDTVHVDSSLKELETVSISKKKTTVESSYIYSWLSGPAWVRKLILKSEQEQCLPSSQKPRIFMCTSQQAGRTISSISVHVTVAKAINLN